jgi:phosphopantothenoylcysteine decarboxylase/phosphopantothenate--cysteine ligase
MPRALLIVGGGVAAYKALELVRLMRKDGIQVRAILTEGGSHFVTPLSLAALSENPVGGDLFDLTAEQEMGHIVQSRWADLIVVAPATADLMAKAANGLATDLATATLLATDTPVLMAPAMNVRMWEHPATRRNLAQLEADGVSFVGPDAGEMACGEFGEGRLAEPPVILEAIRARIARDDSLNGVRVLVTAGPTQEPLDPVRFLSNRSSGKQGYAIAAALERRGAEVTLVSGPTALAAPAGVDRIEVGTAEEMLAACRATLPVDVAVMTAAVADWRPAEVAAEKLKDKASRSSIDLVANPDILAELSKPGSDRPPYPHGPRGVVGTPVPARGATSGVAARVGRAPPRTTGHLHQGLDPIGGRRVGREQIVRPLTRQRVDDEQLAEAGLRSAVG